MNRIRELRNAVNKSQSEMASDLKVAQNTISQWETGNRDIDSDKLHVLADYFNVTIDYLLGRSIDCVPTKSAPELSTGSRMSPSAHRVGRAYDRATPPVKRTVDVALEPYIDEEAAPLMKEIVYYSDPPAAGYGGYLDESPAHEMIELPEDIIPKAASFCVRVNGTSMEPLYPDRCLVFVEGRPSIENGEDGIFIYNGNSVFKRLKADQERKLVSLTSINPDGPTFEIDEDDEIVTIGKVIGWTNYSL